MRGVHLSVLVLALLLACGDDAFHREVGANVNAVITREDVLGARAGRQLVAHGVRALPQIETALHTAAPDGRLRLTEVLTQMGGPEPALLLRHLAVYDTDARVRAAAETRLEVLAGGGKPEGETQRAAARAALAWVASKRAEGHGPVMRPAP